MNAIINTRLEIALNQLVNVNVSLNTLENRAKDVPKASRNGHFAHHVHVTISEALEAHVIRHAAVNSAI